MNVQLKSDVKSTLHLPLTNETKQALLDAALPKLEKAVKQDKKTRSVKLPENMVNAPSLKDKVKAPMSMMGYGQLLGEDYLSSLGKATTTWQQGIVFLLKSCSDIQRNDAMDGAMKVAKACKDETSSSSLKKRISEARRVFKAAQGKGSVKVIKAFEGTGSWHQKVTALPKAGKAGRPKATPKTPVISVEAAMASVEAAGNKLVGVAEGHSKVGVIKLGDAFGVIERLSTPDILKVLDLCAGKLMVSLDLGYQAIGKEVVALRERQEKAAKQIAA